MLHVLVADDSATVQASVASLLKGYGFRTTQTRSAEEALLLVRNHKPDLVLMDVVFPGPGISGFHATRRLCQDPHTADIPVILMSVRGADSDRAWGLRQGASDYLVKPFEAAELVTVLRRNLRKEGAVRHG